jgi:hypothetical protein
VRFSSRSIQLTAAPCHQALAAHPRGRRWLGGDVTHPNGGNRSTAACVGLHPFPCQKRMSTLATVEAIFNLGTLGRNDTSATPMSDLFRGGIP